MKVCRGRLSFQDKREWGTGGRAVWSGVDVPARRVLVKARAGDASIALQNKTGKGVKCGLHGLGWQGCELSYLAKAEDAEGLFNVVDLHLP